MSATCIRLYFTKGERARFLSHLDLQATLEYGMRRAKLPLALSQGFNPRARMSLAAPLPLGYTGEREVLDLWLNEPLEPAEVAERLNGALPPDIRVVDGEVVAEGERNAASRVESATYRVILPSPAEDLPSRIERLLARPAIEIEEERDGKTRKRDIRPLIRGLTASGDGTLSLTVTIGSEGSVRPDEVLRLLDLPLDGTRVVREALHLAQ